MRERLLASSIFGGAALLALTSAPAFAQTAPNEVEGIVVTGSRIVRQDYESNTPIVTVSSETLERTGTVTVESLLNQMPQFVPSVTATSNNPGGSGQANVELRGLGTQRTLVLMDGRRIPPSNSDGTVDLNTIPPGLVESVEVITGGASATYGSDAIAGVVNFRLKKHFSGVEADVQYGITDRHDGESENVSLLMGGDFDSGEGNAVLAFGFSNRGSIANAARTFSSVSGASSSTPLGAYNASGTNLPTQAAVDAVFAQYGVAPGTVARSASRIGFNNNGTLFVVGNNYKGPTTIDYGTIPVTGNYNTGPLNYLVVPLERYNVFSRVEHTLVGNLKAYGQFNYTSYQSGSLLAPSPASSSPAAGGTGFLVPVTNPFVPNDLRTILASRGNPTAPFILQKRFSELGGRRSVSDYTVSQMVAGVTGELVAGWTVDAYIADGRERRLETQYGNVSHAAVRTLLEAADGGKSICAGGYNPFGAQPISAACAAYIGRTTKNYTTFDQRLAEATLQGPVFSLPAGEVRVAVGADYIRNAFNFIPDSVLSTSDVSTSPIPQASPGVIGFNAQNALQGSTDVYELYGEALVPVLKDLPFIKELSLDVAGRFSDYNTIGAVSTWKIDGNWKVFDMLSLRGGYSKAIRAPSVGELYAAAGQDFPTIGPAGGVGSGDPCDVRGAYRKGSNGAAVRALCLAQGVPNQIIDTYTYGNSQVQGMTGGNPNLMQETADTYSAGLVFSPKFDAPILEHVSASVDYYHIKIQDAVGTIGAATSISYCFNNPQGAPSNPTFTNSNIFCGLIRRDPASGEIVQATETNANLGSYETDGIDFQIDWGFGLGAIGLNDSWGRLGFNYVGTYLLNFDVQSIPGGNIDHRAGTIGNTLGSNYSHWKTLLAANWTMDRISVGGRWRYISKVDDFFAGGQAAPAYNYFDIDAGWKINDMFEIRAGVNNVGDKQPPVYTSQIEANTDPSTYDVLGRRYFVGLKARF
ncbi:MAG: TonB-dependent receptor [Phenylobacterium sp.]|jgi:iron complex outermembrane receptor protein|nr:TonB-dependent receptor [Phenylobacterium sp.]